MGHHEHDYTANARDGNRRALAVVLVLTASFTVVEVIGGLLTGSLALLADAGHMLSDNVSLGVALFAAWLAGRPATPEKSFGYRRAEILAALANGIPLVAISIWVFVEAYARLREPAEVLGTPMLAVATLGLLVNATGATILYRSGRGSLNVEGALRHVLADALIEFHDLHIWTTTSGFPALSAHVLVGRHEDCHARRRELEELLTNEYGISHTTLQVDHVGDHHTNLGFPSRLD